MFHVGHIVMTVEAIQYCRDIQTKENNGPQPVALGMLALGAPGLSIWKREESVGATTECN